MTTVEHFNAKWNSIIPLMPHGGQYRFDLRQYGHDIVKDEIKKGSKIFDFACGLGVIDIQLSKEKNCKVSGCDISDVAIDYINSKIKGKFTVGQEIIGTGYDVILAIQILEHLPKPVEWLNKVLKKTKKVICVLPNNFRKTGEHVHMAWNDWDSFYELFKDFKIKRLDENKGKTKYPAISNAFQHPIFEVTK